MRVLQLNNYHYLRGGSERVYLDTGRILKESGHDVFYFSVAHPQNEDCVTSSYFGSSVEFWEKQTPGQRARTAVQILYSAENNRRVGKMVRDFGIELAHAHNIYGRVCPSVLAVLQRQGIPVVMTIHDYKLACPTYTMYREGKVCSDCLDVGHSSVLRNRCVRGSLALSSLAWLENRLHRLLGLYSDCVDRFVCPSQFCLEVLVRAGVPRWKLRHIPNFVLSTNEPVARPARDYVLFAGRLSTEKGLEILVKAARLSGADVRIAGTGPLEGLIREWTRESSLASVRLLGFQSGQVLRKLYANAAAVVVPSQWFENCPMSILESFAAGTPVIGSDIGGIPELVEDGKTGRLFEPANAGTLAQLLAAMTGNRSDVENMAANCIRLAQTRYSSNAYRNSLLDLYQSLVVV